MHQCRRLCFDCRIVVCYAALILTAIGCGSGQEQQTQTLKQSRPSPDYSARPPAELLRLAVQHGLIPEALSDGTLSVRNDPNQQPLISALRAREDEVTALIDPDAPHRKNIVGVWLETNKQAVDPNAKLGTSLFKFVFHKNRQYDEAHVLPSNAGEKLIFSIGGNYHGEWNIRNGVLKTDIGSADNPLLFVGVATGMLGNNWRIKTLTKNMLVLDELGFHNPGMKVYRSYTFQRLQE